MPRESALDNVCLPLIYAGVSKKDRRQMGMEALERVGLSDRADFKPTQLSRRTEAESGDSESYGQSSKASACG